MTSQKTAEFGSAASSVKPIDPHTRFIIVGVIVVGSFIALLNQFYWVFAATLGGLLGTLIPLGPGIVALGQGDTVTLSESMNVAFDTTIAGVISAAVASVISHIRKRWYNDDMVSLETLMEAVLEEVTSDVEG